MPDTELLKSHYKFGEHCPWDSKASIYEVWFQGFNSTNARQALKISLVHFPNISHVFVSGLVARFPVTDSLFRKQSILVNFALLFFSSRIFNLNLRA